MDKNITNAEAEAQKISEGVMTQGHFNCNSYSQMRQIKTALLEMAEWQHQQMIEKAVDWLEKELYLFYSGAEHWVASHRKVNVQEFIEDFKKSMEE